MISGPELSFIDRRTRLIRAWRYAGVAALVVIVAFTGYLFLASPLLINPFHAVEQIEAEALPESTVIVMAALMPVAMLLVMFVMVVLVIFVFAAFASERKLIAIIHRLGDSTRSR